MQLIADRFASARSSRRRPGNRSGDESRRTAAHAAARSERRSAALELPLRQLAFGGAPLGVRRSWTTALSVKRADSTAWSAMPLSVAEAPWIEALAEVFRSPGLRERFRRLPVRRSKWDVTAAALALARLARLNGVVPVAASALPTYRVTAPPAAVFSSLTMAPRCCRLCRRRCTHRSHTVWLGIGPDEKRGVHGNRRRLAPHRPPRSEPGATINWRRASRSHRRPTTGSRWKGPHRAPASTAHARDNQMAPG